jgi:hypothetical protein
MRKSIKVQDTTWQRIDDFRQKRETFDEAINRALDLVGKMGDLLPMLANSIRKPKEG